MKTQFYILIDKLIIKLSILVILLPVYSMAAGGNYGVGSRSISLGGCMLNLSDVWSVKNNQAGMSEIKKFSLALAFQNRFLLKETSELSVAAVIPINSGNLGVGLSRFGYSAYSENKFGIAYGRKLGNAINMGVSLNYFLISIGDNYGNKNLVSFDIGIQTKINPHLMMGLHAENPLMVKLNKQHNENLFSALRVGLKYSFDYPLFIYLEAEKNNYFQKIILRMGIEYKPKNKFSLRIGSSNTDEIFSFGFGFKINSLNINLSASMHNSLGFSTQSDIIYQSK